MNALSPGLEGAASVVVTDELTAVALGSGDVEVYGTPALLALVERACCDAVAGRLDGDRTTVGTWAEVEHLAPSQPGAAVKATAVLASVEGRRLEFRAEVHDGDRLVGRARHRRAIVSRATFTSR